MTIFNERDFSIEFVAHLFLFSHSISGEYRWNAKKFAMNFTEILTKVADCWTFPSCEPKTNKIFIDQSNRPAQLDRDYSSRTTETVLFMIQNNFSDYLLKHLMHMQQIMMLSTNSSEDAGFRSITRKFSPLFVFFCRADCEVFLASRRWVAFITVINTIRMCAWAWHGTR